VRTKQSEKLDLRAMLNAAGAHMSADLRQRFVTHPGELGTGREEIIRSFLRAYLPKRFEIESGFVFDVHGNVSQQQDIVIANAMVCPRFETPGGVRYYPCECVVAVGQVKSSLTATSKLVDALDNLRSVKDLDRSAKGTSVDPIYGEPIDPESNHLHQVFSFLFIIGRTLSPESVQSFMLEHVQRYDAHQWPNVIFSLDKFLLTFCCDYGVCPNPMDARGIALQRASPDFDILARLYVLLGQAIDVTRVGGLSYWQYLLDGKGWDATIWHSIDLDSDGPPLLSSLVKL
jgi:hypothetical protein